MMHDIEKLNAKFAPKKKQAKEKPKNKYEEKTGVEPPNYCNKNGAILAARQIMDFWKEKGHPDVVMSAIPLSSHSKDGYYVVRQISGPPIATLDTRRPEKTGPRRAKY